MIGKKSEIKNVNYNRLIIDKYYGDKPEDIFDIERGIDLYNKKHFTGCFGGK